MTPFNNALAVETYLDIGDRPGHLVQTYTQGEHGRGAYYRIKEFEKAGLIRLTRDGRGKRVTLTIAGFTVLEHLRIVAALSEVPTGTRQTTLEVD